MAGKKAIAVFDSGVGGITVLREIRRQLPDYSFIYYADLKNVPYGIKSKQEVLDMTRNALLDMRSDFDIAAAVLACNTATSAAAEQLRLEFNFPIIGMEPALKPALKMAGEKKVLVLATAFTLKEEKFKKLIQVLDADGGVISIAAPGLVQLAENGTFSGQKVEDYLQSLVSGIDINDIGVVVLGCTHFIYFKEAISSVYRVPTIDGNKGTVKQLRKKLDLEEVGRGEAGFINSGKKSTASFFQKWLDVPV